MAVPFYVSPDQIMQDKAEYARKGIAKGRSIVAVEYADGLLLMAENPSASLNKISEIYDRIAFAGVGKYSEFENLRKAGIRYADLKGYSYSRQDVTTKSLANAYSETMGTIFTRDPKPLEVEILVVEVGETPAQNEMYHVSFDGTITDRRLFAVIGGQADRIRASRGECSGGWPPRAQAHRPKILSHDAGRGCSGDGGHQQWAVNIYEKAHLRAGKRVRYCVHLQWTAHPPVRKSGALSL
jgi:proteasome alpha subunit